MSKHQYVLEVPPGSIVFVKDSNDLKRSRFGIVVAPKFWVAHGQDRDKELYFSCEKTQVPYWGMDAEHYFHTSFQDKGAVAPLGSVFSPDEEFERLSNIFECFTFRDGSDYYNAFHRHLNFVRSCVVDKTGEAVQLTDPIFKEFIRSLQEWKNQSEGV
ncbi:MAG: hypothetical protein JWN37_41 [Candidatus Nomurabacteria bacterium]|nr:hypothetical protein [Candidatus Nomurabacteria bacterium]